MKEILLINIIGSDKPGVTSAITGILAQYHANVLDIGQAVIHDHLTLGFLVEIPKESESSPVLKDVLFKCHEMDMQVRFSPITEESYGEWVSQQGKSRYIVTLLSRKLAADQMSEVSSIATRHGLNIDQISRLSGRVELNSVSSQSKACVEFSARGTPADLKQLRSDFMELSSRMEVDVAFQEDSLFRRNRRLVCFDMDSTLIETEVIDELAIAAGVGDQVSEITEAAMRGELDFTESFKRRMALLKGLDESVLAEIAERLPVTEGAEHLISTLRFLGFKTAILSGGFNYFGNYLKEKLGMDYVYANELEIEDGKVTGNVSGVVVDGARKAQLLCDIAKQENISLEQVIAVGDGANDLGMLSVAGLGIAFRAKPLVKAEAEQSISTLGLDAILYLIGFRDRDNVA